METNTIQLGELSKYNGKTELENAKMIISLLMIKAAVNNIPQKITVTCKGR